MLAGLASISVTEFRRNSGAVLRRLKRSGAPRILTFRGKPVLVIQDATAFAIEREQSDRDYLAGLREAIAQADRGECRPADEFFDELLGRKPAARASSARGARSQRKASRAR